ncbi:hypothetical protein [Nostoc sp. FACHB-190]|uniref:hypothetical protein n=1 Tax=Nostoc sp. FACHB-190 TaxID=2692838 RepID=UPI0016830FE7|nr:hypothetical protein [Nostoc sp. FACHB-190]MBD2298954.1 hypothetical protein [Nostoc sp. FACHB-190]
MNNYESRRLTISYLAVQELRQMFGIPEDAPTQALSAAVEKLIFQGGATAQSQTVVQVSPLQPNKSMLANMARQAA